MATEIVFFSHQMEKSGHQKVVRKIFASNTKTLSFKNIPVRLGCIKALNYHAAYIALLV